jgi:tetratricopeptide (TPR) repeat protein
LTQPSDAKAEQGLRSQYQHSQTADVDQQAAASLRAQGRDRLKANAFTEAIEVLARALTLEPNDPQTRLNLGIALQGARRHADAVKMFSSVQQLLPEDPAAFLHAAVSLLDLGDVDAALRAASDACHRGPRLPQAHYAYGQAWLALNEHVKAERAFAEALRLTPGWADAWVNYGIARYNQGAIEDAKTAMRSALRHNPDHATATANLGAFMRISGESSSAEELLRATLVRQPDNAAARLNLVADFLQDERADDALALLEEKHLSAVNPRAVRHWHLQKSLALLQLGRTAEAKTELDALAALGPIPANLAPLWQWRQVLLARSASDLPRAREAAEQMEAALETMGPGAVLEHRIMGHYDLAKFWSGQNAHSRAFAHWKAGHDLLKPSQPFSRDAHRAFVDANIAAFDQHRFAAGLRARNTDPAPVFIVGMPRSGTTLCEQILAGHAQGHGAGERNALSRAFHALGGAADEAACVCRIAALGADALDEAASRYLADLHALAPDKARIVDKLPGNFNYLGLVGLMLPGAKIIHCARDPRDIGLSIFTFRFHGAHGYAHDLADLGWYIGEYNRLMAHWKAALPNPILTVKLSDWVEDFDGTLARVLTHIDLPHDPNCARFYESDSRVQTVSRAQVRQPINAHGLGRWKAYAAELAPLIEELERAGIAPPEDTGTMRPQDSATRHPADDEAKLRIWKPDDPAVALGLAVGFLMKERNFTSLPFGSWSRVLTGQINRGHFCLVVDGERRVHGFLGWALTDERLAELWLAGRATLADEDCRAGNCVIVNAWAATSTAANNLLIDESIRLFGRKLRIYGRRYDTRGEPRPRRISSPLEFVATLRAIANRRNKNARGGQEP